MATLLSALFPEYWECCEARKTAKIGEWEVEYLPKFLEASKQHDCRDYFIPYSWVSKWNIVFSSRRAYNY